MHGGYPFRHPREQAEDGGRRERAVLGDRGLQERSRDIGGSQPGSGRVGIRIEDWCRVMPLYPLRGGDFPPEPAPELGVFGEYLFHDLDRDRAAATGE
jgi:hypothetical protein